MRFLLSLSVDTPQAVIPINYSYEIASWIYKMLEQGDRPFSDWLHNQGYVLGEKQFRLFTFSQLRVPRRKIEGDRLHIQSSHVSLTISFCVEDLGGHFLMGVFRAQKMRIADRIGGATFTVENVTLLESPQLASAPIFSATTPVCVAESVMYMGKPSARYCVPDEPDYGERLMMNLIHKYIALQTFLGKAIDPSAVAPAAFQYKLLSQPWKRAITIAAHSERETRLIGYQYDFELQAPLPLLQVMYDAGLGEKNSMGFGFVETKK